MWQRCTRPQILVDRTGPHHLVGRLWGICNCRQPISLEGRVLFSFDCYRLAGQIFDWRKHLMKVRGRTDVTRNIRADRFLGRVRGRN